MIAVTLIDAPNPNLRQLVSVVQKCIAMNPLDTVDNSPRMFSEAAKAIIGYNTLRNPAYKTAVEAIRDSRAVQPLFNFTFLCAAVFEVQIEAICLNTGLKFVTANTFSDASLFLMGGSLDLWREAVCVGSKNEVTRPLFNTIFTEFDRAGLSEVWSEYDRPAAKGGFLIERRK